MRKFALIGLVVLVAAVAGAWSWYRSDVERAIRVSTGLVSHEICSGMFVSGLSADQIFAENIRPRAGVSLIAWGLAYTVDTKHRAVTATFAGGFMNRAVFRDGLGCQVVHGAEPAEEARSAQAVAAQPHAAALLPEIAGPAVVEPADDKMRVALDRAFAEPENGPAHRTKAVVVVQDGRIIAERYAPGYGPDTPVVSYSVAKSATNALLGILVRQGKLSVDAPAPVAAWQGADDPRRRITIDQLERMTSGLAIDERNTGFDPWPRALFLEPDVAAAAESVPLEAAPGSTWSYTSGNTMILSRIIRDAVGGHAADVLSFARRELFDPLGMRRATMDFDEAGTPIGSTYFFAPARDWARLGMLYLDDGVVGGKRILPEGWVAYSSARTFDSPYAAGFWLGLPKWRAQYGVPSDTFFAAGILGQRIYVIPSQRLVVARFGLWDEAAGAPEVARLTFELIADIVAAVKPRTNATSQSGLRN